MKSKRGILRTGTSGIVLPLPKKHFPEPFRQSSRLNYYSVLFNTLEINSSFYKLPKPATFEKWANDVADDFRFTVKLWRTITHQKKLVYTEDDIYTFMNAANHIGKKKGCLLVQFPASITADYDSSVEKILACLDDLNTSPRWKVCVEFRDPSWYDNYIVKMLARYRAFLVFHDIPKSKTPLRSDSRVIYLRFHGPQGTYRGSYTEEFLLNQAHMIHGWLSAGKDVYVYFNNTIGAAFNNAQFLHATVHAMMNKNHGAIVQANLKQHH